MLSNSVLRQTKCSTTGGLWQPCACVCVCVKYRHTQTHEHTHIFRTHISRKRFPHIPCSLLSLLLGFIWIKNREKVQGNAHILGRLGGGWQDSLRNKSLLHNSILQQPSLASISIIVKLQKSHCFLVLGGRGGGHNISVGVVHNGLSAGVRGHLANGSCGLFVQNDCRYSQHELSRSRYLHCTRLDHHIIL